MRDVQRQTRSYLMALFQQHGFNPRTDLGQNFLIDVNLIEFVVRNASLGPCDVVLEVGSGTGGMTSFLAAEAGKVVSIEIDRNMFQLAGESVSDCNNVTLLNCDILKNKNTLDPQVVELLHREVASIPDGRLKLVANLPYSVATPVISNLINSDLPWQRMVATIQWELGEKMAAQPGDSSYGALSVWLQSQSTVRILRKLGPKVFWPRPKVDSAIVSIWRDTSLAARIHDRPFFLDFLRRLFHHRRKFLRSVLVGMYRRQLLKTQIDQVLADLAFAPEMRAEKMDVEMLIRLSNHLRLLVTDPTDEDQPQNADETDPDSVPDAENDADTDVDAAADPDADAGSDVDEDDEPSNDSQKYDA
jgi:16S rRNA (adenine1518-N6/adenine1519-N6)-dimethyltransferase